MALSHQKIIGRLLNSNNVSAIWMVGRATLNVKLQRSLVLIPDLHLTTKRRAKKYRFSFHHDKDWGPGLATARRKLFVEVGSLLYGDPGVDAFQLGDLFDVWREHPKVDTAVTRIAQGNTAVMQALGSARWVIGNHDRKDADVPDAYVMRRAYTAAQDRILILHGDIFDHVESVPDPLSSGVVYSWLGQQAGSRCFSFGKSKQITMSDQKVPDVTHKQHRLFKEAHATAARLRKGDEGECLRLGLAKKKHPIKAVVIGHTHHAKVVRKQGLLLVDCGAWVERCRRFDAGPALNCQIGVIAPLAGNSSKTDVRVYQLVPR